MYEDYMRNLLGFPMNSFQNTYEQMGVNNDNCIERTNSYSAIQDNYQPNCCMGMQNDYQCGFSQHVPYELLSRNSLQNMSNEDLEDLYPDIYKIIYPMVRKACMQNTRPLTREVIEDMTQEIYSNIEAENVINLNVNIDNRTANSSTQTDKANRIDETKKEESKNIANRQIEESNIQKVENRQFNRPINDLIRILLLRELLGRPGHWRPNPPRPRPPRPNPPRPGWQR